MIQHDKAIIDEKIVERLRKRIEELDCGGRFNKYAREELQKILGEK